MLLKERNIRRAKSEIVCATGKIPGYKRIIAVIGVYIPPRARAPQYHNTMQQINEVISNLKTEFRDPVIICGGDFNRRPIDEAIGDFPDMGIDNASPTRGNALLDIVATNLGEQITNIENRDPLSAPDGRKSDHDSVLLEAEIDVSDRFEWKIFYTRPQTPWGKKKFDTWMRDYCWDWLGDIEGVDEVTEAFISTLDTKFNECFPRIRNKSKNTDDPWITPLIRDKIDDRKKTYRREKRSDAWKDQKTETTKLIKASKREYYDKYKEIALANSDPSLYYKVCLLYTSPSPRDRQKSRMPSSA